MNKIYDKPYSFVAASATDAAILTQLMLLPPPQFLHSAA